MFALPTSPQASRPNHLLKAAMAFASLVGALSCGAGQGAPAETAVAPRGGSQPSPGGAAVDAAPHDARAEATSDLSAPPQPCAETGPRAVELPEQVTLGDFWQALSAQVALLDTAALETTFEDFARRHELDPETPGLRQDFT